MQYQHLRPNIPAPPVQQRRKLATSAISVPTFSHSTVDSILEINQHLLRILTEFQNNGWTGQQEQKVYHQRLQTNLTYLATMADAAGNDKAFQPPAVDTTPVVYPPEIAHLSTNRQSEFVRLISCSTEETRHRVINSVSPPVMLTDPAAQSKSDSTSKTYPTAPPFVTSNSHVPGFAKIDETTVKAVLERTLNSKGSEGDA